MPRLTTLALVLGASLSSAAAQTGQFPGVAPPVPAPRSSAVPQPPIIYSPNLNGPTAAPNLMMPVAPVPSRAPVLVPGAPPGRDSFSDRVGRCIAAGTAAGIGPNDLGAFTSQCAQ